MATGWSLLRTLSLLCLVSLAGCEAVEHIEIELAPEQCRVVAVSGAIALELQLDQSDTKLMVTLPATARQNFEHQLQDGLSLAYPGPDALQAQLNCPEVKEVNLLGSAQVQVLSQRPTTVTKVAAYGTSQYLSAAINTDELQVRASGDARLEVGDVDIEKGLILLGGKAQLNMSGSAAELKVQASGASQLSGADLSGQTVSIEATGDSQIAIHSSAHLSGQLRDRAQLVYGGTPDLQLQTLDQSSLTAKSNGDGATR